MLMDVNIDMFNLFISYLPLLNSKYQDIYGVVLLLSPELIFALNDFFASYFLSSSINLSPASVFDSYVNNLNYSFHESVVTFLMFVLYI